MVYGCRLMNGCESEEKAAESLNNETLRYLPSCIEPDERCCSHASEHWNLLWYRKISLSENLPLIIDKR